MLILGKKKKTPMAALNLPLVPPWTKVWAIMVAPLGLGLALAMALEGERAQRITLAATAAILFAVVPGMFFFLWGLFTKINRGSQKWLRRIPLLGGVVATSAGICLTVLGLVALVALASAPFLLGMEAAGITNGTERKALSDTFEKSRIVLQEVLKPNPAPTERKVESSRADLFDLNGGPKLPTGSATRGRY
ncbi:MAG: hypothetical protein RL326_2050 [Pseudomonadota bacterium]